jgi:hypothetical protein
MKICKHCCVEDMDFTKSEFGMCFMCGTKAKVINLNFYSYEIDDPFHRELGGEG